MMAKILDHPVKNKYTFLYMITGPGSVKLIKLDEALRKNS